MRNSARAIINRGSMTDRGQAERIVSFMEALNRPVGAPNECLNKLFDIATEVLIELIEDGQKIKVRS